MILLKDEEMDEAVKESLLVQKFPVDTHKTLRAISKAQLKKVAEWGGGGCPHGGCLPGGHYEFKRSQCFKCWQALLKEAEIP